MSQYDPNQPPHFSGQQYPPNPRFENNSPLNPNYQPDEFVAPFSNYPPPKRKRHVLRNILIAIGGLFMLLVVAAVLSPDSPEAKAPVAVTTQAVETPVPSTPPSAATQPSPKVTHKPAPTTTKPKLTASQEQAVGTAEDYLDTSAFSKSGLIDQLVYEGFSQADARYAVAHITVNWNEQAALSAKEYLDVSHFSRSGLIGQLEYEGFTHSQAVYGVTKAGL